MKHNHEIVKAIQNVIIVEGLDMLIRMCGVWEAVATI